MAITTTWKIAELERDIATGGVKVAHYRVDSVDGSGDESYTAGAYGTMGFEPDATAKDFTPFEDVTEAQVIGWVKEALGGDEKVAEIEQALADKIEADKNPVTAVGVPWANSAE